MKNDAQAALITIERGVFTKDIVDISDIAEAIETIRKALAAPVGLDKSLAHASGYRSGVKDGMQAKPVDVKELKRSLVDDGIFMDSWNECIDHLNERGLIRKPEDVYCDHCGETSFSIRKPLYWDGLRKMRGEYTATNKKEMGFKRDGWNECLDHIKQIVEGENP